MDDLISRQSAIDALCDEYCGGWQDCKYYPKCENLKVIQNLPSAQQWIPCSERLPDEREERYWCCSEGGYQFQCRWTNDMYGLGANEYSKWGWHVMDKPQYSTVIAWMPLPKPYKEERKES